MSDLSQEIQRIEGYMVELGIMDAADANGVADADFFEALDQTSRLLAVILEQPDVIGYSEEFGNSLLAGLASVDPDKLEEQKENLRRFANIDVTERGIGKFAEGRFRQFLIAAGVPESKWKNFNVGGLLPIIENAEAIIADASAIVTDPEIEAARSGLQASQDAEIQQAVTTVLHHMGFPEDVNPAIWLDPQTHVQLQEQIKTLQEMTGWPPADSYGAFTPEFAAHLQGLIDSGSVPGSLPAEDWQDLVDAMTLLYEQGLYVTPEPPITTADSARAVESVFKGLDGEPGLISRLNDALARGRGMRDDNVPESFRPFLDAFIDTSILDKPIPEITEVDGIFDLRTQASLQATLRVLGHPQVMGFPWDESLHGYYTPETGRYILENLDKLKTTLKQVMSEEEFADLDEQLTPENLAPVFESLDHLYGQGLIAHWDLLNRDYAAADMTQRIFQERVDVLIEAGNSDLIKLMDEMTRQYSGQPLVSLMPDLEIPSYEPEHADNPQAALQAYYKAARERHAGDQQSFDAELVLIIESVIALPFGDGPYRTEFYQKMRQVVDRASAESDPDRAAEIFAQGVTEASEALRDEHGEPYYISYREREVPVWKPGLSELSLTSNGQTFDINALVAVYDNYQLAFARPERQERGLSNSIDDQHFVTFTAEDESGNSQQYVALIDASSAIFSIEPIDTQRLREILSGIEEKMARLEAEMPTAWASIDREDFVKIMMVPGQGLSEDLENKIERLGAIEPEFRALDMERFREIMYEPTVSFGDALKQAREEIPAFAMLCPPGRTAQGYSYGDLIHLLENDVPQLSALSTDMEQRVEAVRTGIASAPAASERSITFIPTTSLSSEHRVAARGDDAPEPVVARQMTADQIRAQTVLRDVVRREIYNGFAVYTAQDQGKIDLLKRFEGQDLQIGANLGASLGIRGVQLPPEGVTGPLLTFFDVQTGLVRAFNIPEYLTNPDMREALNEFANGATPSSSQMLAFKDQYPEFYQLLEAQRVKVFQTARPRFEDENFDIEHLYELHQLMPSLLKHVEDELAPRVEYDPSTRYRDDRSLRDAFGDVVDKVREIPGQARQVPGAVRDIAGAYGTSSAGAVRDLAGAARDAYPEVRETVTNAPREVVTAAGAIGRAYGDSSVEAGRDLVRELPKQAEETWKREMELPSGDGATQP